MQLVLLILINVIMGTIFYLILRLKLEKYASDYREKRLKREMDEIICEFNATAERNISILENRIEIFKKLLEKSGAISKIDFSVDDDKEHADKPVDIKDGKIILEPELEKISASGNKAIPEVSGEDRVIFKYSRQIKEKFESFKTIINKQNIFTKKKSDSPSDEPAKHPGEDILNNNKDDISDAEFISGQNLKGTIDISINDMSSDDSEKDNGISDGLLSGDSEGLNETELEQMFEASEDKYSLISELLDKGYKT